MVNTLNEFVRRLSTLGKFVSDTPIAGASGRLKRVSFALGFLLLALAIAPAMAQISFGGAIDLAVRNSPKVQMAQANVDKARAALAETHDVFVPNLVFGSAVGPPSYGFPLGQPSIFNVTSQSLVFSYAQRDYIRSARAALEAANLALRDARLAVAEDTAIAYLALDRDAQRKAALGEEANDAKHLVTIVQDRFDAGQDSAINLTTARLTAAQIRLAALRADDEASGDQDRLAQMIGLPARALTIASSSIPSLTASTNTPSGPLPASSPAVEAAYATAHAKRLIAFGDQRYLWRPQISFFAQYSLYSTFNNYQIYYNRFQQNNAGIGVEITLPIFDKAHGDKARESAAEAVHAEREADLARNQFLEGRVKLEHTAAELSAQAEVAGLDQQLAQQQLDVMLVQLKSGTGNPGGVQMSPKDAANAEIAERQKFLAVVDANFAMRQAQINLLRQTGRLEEWIKSAAQTPSPLPMLP